MNDFPRISFGMIVLNGEPFIRYNLRALYPFAHQIIVVEGAVQSAANSATHDGHSTDNTLETLVDFKAHEDPDNKLILITKDAFWREKEEMSQAYAAHTTGDYLWQVDSDEFYHPEAMQKVISLLRKNPRITAMSFRMMTFWGSPDYIVDGWYLHHGANVYHRLFKWGVGYTYTSHRPPTVRTSEGISVKQIQWLNGDQTHQEGILLYHYSLLFPKQVEAKSDYYRHVDWGDLSKSEQWAHANYLNLQNPFRVHNVYQHPSWLERFNGVHPPQICQMWEDIQSGKIQIPLRQTMDIEHLINSKGFQIKRNILKRWAGIDLFLLNVISRTKRLPYIVRRKFGQLVRRSL